MIKAFTEEERYLLAKRDKDNQPRQETPGFFLFLQESDPHLLLQSYREALSWKDPTPIFDQAHFLSCCILERENPPSCRQGPSVLFGQWAATCTDMVRTRFWPPGFSWQRLLKHHSFAVLSGHLALRACQCGCAEERKLRNVSFWKGHDHFLKSKWAVFQIHSHYQITSLDFIIIRRKFSLSL